MALIINVKDKVAQAAESYTLVCGNSDYVIYFNFDEEWNEHDVKTARFRYAQGGLIKTQDVVFTGTECAVPVLTNTLMVDIGVYAGDLRTTTPCSLFCLPSILCGEGIPEAPAVGVYLQIIKMIEEGMLVGPQGPEGPQGPAGSIAIIPVDELPTEDYVEGAIYIVPKNEPESENKYLEYLFINGKPEPIGEINVGADLTDYVKKTDYATGSTVGVVMGNAAGGIAVNANGALSVIAANENMINTRKSSMVICPTNLDYAVKKGLADSKLADTVNAWTEEEQAAARALLNAVGTKDYADYYGKMGLVGVSNNALNSGLQITNGVLNLFTANKERIDAKTNKFTPITPNLLDYAVKKALADCKLAGTADEWTAAEQAAARALLGIAQASANEDGTLTIQLADGTKYTVNATKI